ncbi:MAG: DUF1345 domain-containing protein [Massilia sp.]
MDNKRLLHRFIRTRPHLSLAIFLGVVIGLMLPAYESPLGRALVGWNCAVWAYILSMTWLMARSDARKVREIASRQDESAGLVLFTLTIGAVLSLSAIVFELSQIPHLQAEQRLVRYAFTALTVVGSWLLVAVLYCFHYAHLYYRGSGKRAPLHFPDDPVEPDYWDFMYFSITIAVAFQTADVSVMTRAMRKMVLGHSVLSFFFNVTILGLSINIAAGMLNH